MKVLAIYPGRFQPFHKGHGLVYKWLKNKFGNVVIATSNKVALPKSPFNYDEKKSMMQLAGVNPQDIAQVSMPYIASEILQHYDPKDTVIIFAVSQKDMEEDPRFNFAPTKTGKPGYLQPYKGNENNLKPFGDPKKPSGYVIVTPTFDFTVLGKPMRSASELRAQFADAKDDVKKKIVKDLFGNYSEKVFKLMKEKIKKQRTLSEMRNKNNNYVVESVTHDDLQPILDKFVQFAADHLKLKKIPPIHLVKEKSEKVISFGGYNIHSKDIIVRTKHRHPMDIFRTVAHELVHAKQDEEGHVEKAGDAAGNTGHPLENEANAVAGIIMRNWGRENPEFFKLNFVVENYLYEGINDKSTFKAVFLAGGPGSGKDFIMRKTIDGTGMTEINSDNAFEYMMKREGLDPKMPDSEEAIRNIVRGRSKNIAREKQRLALAGRLGVIINGTADDPDEMALLKQGFEDMGYETMMIFVDTSDEISKQRNIERGAGGGREVKEPIRKQKWEDAQAAKPVLEKIFGKENFIIVDNSEDARKADPETKKKIEDTWQRAFKQVRRFAAKPVDNPAANAWYQGELQKRGVAPEKFVPPAQTFGTQTPAQPKPVPQNVANFVSTPVPRQAQPQVQQQVSVDQHTAQPVNTVMQQAAQLGLSYYGFGRFGKEVKGVHVVTHKEQNGKLVPRTPITQQVAESADDLREDLRKWFREKWVRFDTKGNIKGPCAREEGEGKPKCRPLASARAMSKAERAKSAKRKRREDPVADRSGKGGKPVFVKTEAVNWKQQAAIAIAKKNKLEEDLLNEKNTPTNPALWSKAKSLAKQKFDVYPSAYANGWASKWYKSKGGGWKSVDESFEAFAEEHGAGFEGTTKLAKRYRKDTPGQVEADPLPGRTAVSSPFYENAKLKVKIKKQLKKKSLKQEDNSLALGYEFGNNGIGDTYGIPRSPSGIGMGYSLPLIAGNFSESVTNWANSPSTMKKFTEKYGTLAEQKIIETAKRIAEWQQEPNEKGLYSGRGDGVDEQSPNLMSVMPRKSDYVSKFPGVKGNPAKEAQYARQRAIKHNDAHLYASQHSPTKMVGMNAPKDKRPLEEAEQLDERGEDSKGYYRSTESGAGLTRKGAKHFGIQTAVTTPPSKLKKGSKAAKRRKSFCARMGGMRGPMKDEKGRPTRKAMSLRRWNCEE